MLKKLTFRPGITTNTTEYSSTGTWVDCDKVRFRDGYPERFGGWSKASTDQFTGVCRHLHRWAGSTTETAYTGVGTSRFYYIYLNGTRNEVTPIRRQSTLNNPFDTVNLSRTITVHHTAHGAVTGDSIIVSNADVVGGIDPDGSYTPITVTDANTYTYEHASPATSTVTGGGGAAVLIKYILHPGDSSGVTGGWGAGPWGAGTWGMGGTAGNAFVGLWTAAQWGVDVAICARDSFIAYISTASYTNRALRLDELPGATDPPSKSIMVITSTRDRHLIALGATVEGGSTQDKMLVRWCDQENIAYWTTDDTHTAGSILLDRGSHIVTGRATRSGILIWTNQALYVMGYIGPPYIFGVELLADRVDIAGINSAIVVDDVVYWLGKSGFYTFSGAVTKLHCPIWDKIFLDIAWSYADKIYASTNRRFNEVVFFYPSITSDGGDCDSYVCYSMDQDIWYFGTMQRTAWLDAELLTYPIGAGIDGYLYEHEAVTDDGSVSPAVGVEAFIESAPVEIAEGQQWAFIRSIYHDMTFREATSTPSAPEATIILAGINRPGGGLLVDNTEDRIVKAASAVIEQFTDKADVRLRARGIILRVQSDTLNSPWRLGTPRLDMRTDGQR